MTDKEKDTDRLEFLADRPDKLKQIAQEYDWMGRDLPQRRREFRRFVDKVMKDEK